MALLAQRGEFSLDSKKNWIYQKEATETGLARWPCPNPITGMPCFFSMLFQLNEISLVT